MSVIDLNGEFQGWQVFEEEGIICCDAGLGYRAGEIRAIFYWRELYRGQTGTPHQIQFLKEHLEQKINAVCLPEIVVNWGDVTVRYKHPNHGR